MKASITGVVVSDSSDKTITVAVNRRVAHPIYRKQYNHTKKFRVHDEKNEAKVGDKVDAEEVRPISKSKNFKLVRIVEKAKVLGGGEK